MLPHSWVTQLSLGKLPGGGGGGCLLVSHSIHCKSASADSRAAPALSWMVVSMSGIREGGGLTPTHFDSMYIRNHDLKRKKKPTNSTQHSFSCVSPPSSLCAGTCDTQEGIHWCTYESYGLRRDGCRRNCSMVVHVAKCCKGYFGPDCQGRIPTYMAGPRHSPSPSPVQLCSTQQAKLEELG